MRRRLIQLPSLVGARNEFYEYPGSPTECLAGVCRPLDDRRRAGQLLLDSAAAIVVSSACHVDETDLRAFLLGESMLIGWSFISTPKWVHCQPVSRHRRRHC